MANKAISELPQAQNVNNQDLFVLEQGGIAKKLPAETFITEQGIIDALAEALDGHGGIQSVTLASVSGRIRTYRITFSDGSATTFQVYDGTSIDRISRTSSSGLDDVYTVFLSDGTTTFFTVHNGADGDVSEAMLNDALKDKAPAVTETTESSAIATFTDGADDMPLHNILAEINPVQDLTYGDPYPAGGGKNKLTVPNANFTISGIEFISSNGQITINGNNTAGSGISSLNENFKSNWSFSIPAGTYYFSRGSFNKATYLYHDVSGSVVALATNNGSFTLSEQDTVWVGFYVGASDSFNMVVPDIQLEVGSAKTSFEPVANICPITGWSGCNVTRTGKNLLPNLTYASGNNRLLGVSSDSFTIYLKAGVSYTFSRNTAVSCGAYMQGSSDSSNTMLFGSATASGVASKTFTVSYDGLYKFWLYKSGGGVAESDISYFQLEIGSSATAYEAPQVQTVTVDWTSDAGTVYGGTIDVATGLLTVERVSITIDGTERYWYAVDNNPNIYNVVFTNTDLAPIHQSTDVLTNQGFTPTAYNYATMGNNIPSVCLRYNESSQWRIYVATSNTTLAALKTYLGNNPLQIVYPLAIPQTYQLTGQQLKTLLGTNNVWADIGNVSVTYTADTKLYIEKLTMPTEDDMVANQAITSGKYFMIGNSLYLALANIASGAQITIGTNAQRVSLADALNTINS